MNKTIRISQLEGDLNQRIQQLQNDPGPVERSRERLIASIADDRAVYGVNTGFGILANQRIANHELAQLQRNLLLSHACGVGEPVPKPISRLMLQLKAHALGLGSSGISMTTFQQLLRLIEAGIVPYVPSRGSLGASGDLAPLAHLSLPLIGLGQVWDESASGPEDAAAALQRHGISPITLEAKDGLALINGTQLMSGYGAYILRRAHILMKVADILAAMSLEALQGSAVPFTAEIHSLRPHAGQIETAANIRHLLGGSEILESHRHCGKVQDPYCLRCVPQVHGASRIALAHVISVIETEINSVTDNPLVLSDGQVVSGGNFHGQPLALSLDYAALALAEYGSISERRTYLLLAGHDGLPTLLMQDTGINSGFMIPQYTAAALVSENKVLAHPASVDSIPTSLGQEDHVSMGSVSALKLLQVLENTEQVLAVELLSAAQALDFRLPLKPGQGAATAHEFIRQQIGHAEKDYLVGDDINRCAAILRSGALLEAVENAIGTLH
ncbi:MAG: histidine ammonia-lyase [Wenzhouxiangellaceae bacterium]